VDAEPVEEVEEVEALRVVVTATVVEDEDVEAATAEEPEPPLVVKMPVVEGVGAGMPH
jgi:hypothetical protein